MNEKKSTWIWWVLVGIAIWYLYRKGTVVVVTDGNAFALPQEVVNRLNQQTYYVDGYPSGPLFDDYYQIRKSGGDTSAILAQINAVLSSN